MILPMVKSHYPRCLQCFPTQENLTTKTLNPKVTSFVIQVSLTSSSLQNLQRNTYIVNSNRHNGAAPVNNRVTIQAYDTRYNGLIQKSCHASTKSCHDFPPAETIHSAKKIATRLPKSCHDFGLHRIRNLKSISRANEIRDGYCLPNSFCTKHK